MPFCPSCRAEYIEGVDTCEECGIPLVESLPSVQKRAPVPKLVDVWHTQGEMQAQMIKSLLESDGIDSMLSGEALRLTHGLTIDGLAEVRILVREEDAARASDIIASLDGITLCPRCGRPAYVADETCPRCGAVLDADR
jgi:predicted amidophosphoribosyltransferase